MCQPSYVLSSQNLYYLLNFASFVEYIWIISNLSLATTGRWMAVALMRQSYVLSSPNLYGTWAWLALSGIPQFSHPKHFYSSSPSPSAPCSPQRWQFSPSNYYLLSLFGLNRALMQTVIGNYWRKLRSAADWKHWLHERGHFQRLDRDVEIQSVCLIDGFDVWPKIRHSFVWNKATWSWTT